MTVTYQCADSLSGVQNCPPAQVKGQGGSQTASGTATDNAGNTAGASLTGINVDLTAPTISGAALTLPNTAG